jgi:hypothetical protein
LEAVTVISFVESALKFVMHVQRNAKNMSQEVWNTAANVPRLVANVLKLVRR